MSWAPIHTGHLYNSDGGWEARWQGAGPRPVGPFGTQVGVFNTSHAKASKCADTFNEQLKDLAA